MLNYTDSDERPRLVGLDKGAEVLGGLSRGKLRQLIDSGEIRTVKIGRRRLIPSAELDAYVDKLMADAS